MRKQSFYSDGMPKDLRGLRAMRKPKPPLEKVEQAQIVKLIRSIGGAVYVLGTHRRKGDYQGTMQTPGVPDLIAFLPALAPRLGFHAYIECKRVGGAQSPAQECFQQHCLEAGVFYVLGTFDDVVKFLTMTGYLKAENVPHYRRRA